MWSDLSPLATGNAPLTQALGGVIRPDFIAVLAGAVKPTRAVQAELLTTAVGEVPALVHI